MIKFNWPIWGHQRIIKSLQNSISSDKLAHAYLFSGPKQVGKMTVAKYFIKSIQCQGDVKPCQKCKSCQSLDRNIHPDTVIIDHRNSIKIEDMRELQHKFNLKSQGQAGNYKIALINNAENMTEEAANSILKFLEEPKGKTIIILITEAEGALLPTIISRCQIVKFLPVPIDIIKKELYNLIKNKQKSEQLAYLCGGKPGLAISFTNNPELIQNQAKIINQLENLVQSRLSERINFVLKVGKNRNHILELLDVWLSCFRYLLLISENKRVQTTFQFLKNEPIKLSIEYSKDKLLNLIRNIYKTKLLISKNVNLKLALENLVINF
jgi:DNA polymerase-3 subunit delta'